MRIIRQKNPTALRRLWETVPGVSFPTEEQRETAPRRRGRPVSKIKREKKQTELRTDGWLTAAEASAICGRTKGHLYQFFAAKGLKKKRVLDNGQLRWVYPEAEVREIIERFEAPLIEPLVGWVMLKDAAEEAGVPYKQARSYLDRQGIRPLTMLVKNNRGYTRRCALLTPQEADVFIEIWRRMKR